MDNIKNLKLKRDDAIQSVKRNLKKYAYLKKYPIKYYQRLESFSSSLIVVSNNEISNNNDLPMLRELKKEEDDTAFIKKYDYLLSSLVPSHASNIYRIYFENEKIVAIKEENQNIFTIINSCYEMIACLDDDIDYSVNDYAEYIAYTKALQKKSDWSIKKEALRYLEGFANGIFVDEITLVLQKIPTESRKILIDYIFSEDKFYTTYDYRKIKRSILLFAYYYERIDFELDDLERELAKTGGGWKKFMTTSLEYAKEKIGK